MLMRLTPIALSAAIMVATFASAGLSQKPDNQIDPRSMALTRQADALNAQGHYSDATDLLESALAVDPRNRAAYVGLAHAAQGEKMFGKAIKLYFDALKLEPNDVDALAGQGEALVERGAHNSLQSRMTLPELPERITSKPFWKSLYE